MLKRWVGLHVRYRGHRRPFAGGPVDRGSGYDSAGVATVEHGKLELRRAEDKLVDFECKLKAELLDGFIGIGHTRWATHGVPNELNAHRSSGWKAPLHSPSCFVATRT